MSFAGALMVAACSLSMPQQQDPEWGEPEGRSFLIPALEIVAFEVLLNLYDRNYQREDAYRSDLESIKENLGKGWIVDDDPFAMNQFLHPYSGSLFHGFARSAGLTYWEALPFDVGGSVLWEIAGETESPSINDLISTSIGGSFLGEALFRMASHLLESGEGKPGFFRELGAALVSPPTGVNRLAFNRFDGIFPSHDPATLVRFGMGARRNAHLNDVEAVAEISRDEFVANFSMSYGMPGKPGYEYARPFDYFDVEAALTTGDGALPESVMIRGLLIGDAYEAGDSYRGLWGLYGIYDYLSPDVFSVSSTALGAGTTGQYRFSEAITGQGTALLGFGYAAVGSIGDASEDRDFHYGYCPLALVSLRFIFGEVAMLELSGREYYIGRHGSADAEGKENVLRGQIQLTVRVYGGHALGLQFVSTTRDSGVFDVEDGLESVGAMSLFYTFVSDQGFGAVK